MTPAHRDMRWTMSFQSFTGGGRLGLSTAARSGPKK
jgi:hypothetical protein